MILSKMLMFNSYVKYSEGNISTAHSWDARFYPQRPHLSRVRGSRGKSRGAKLWMLKKHVAFYSEHIAF
jgi:hypothetical protein